MLNSGESGGYGIPANGSAIETPLVAEGSNRHRRCQRIVEDRFGPDNADGRLNKLFECRGILLDALSKNVVLLLEERAGGGISKRNADLYVTRNAHAATDRMKDKNAFFGCKLQKTKEIRK